MKHEDNMYTVMLQKAIMLYVIENINSICIYVYKLYIWVYIQNMSYNIDRNQCYMILKNRKNFL